MTGRPAAKEFLKGALLLAMVAVSSGQVSDFSPRDQADRLASGKPAEVDAALQQIRAQLSDVPWPTATYIRGYWLKPLREANRNEDALKLCESGVVAGAQDTSLVEFLQRQRVELLQLLNRREEALAQAKALFNVCSMQNTEQTLLLLAECLNAAKGNESGLTERLAAEQRAAFAARPGVPAASQTLRGIRVDGAPYEEAIAHLKTPDGRLPLAAQELLALGNLYLLADRPADAAAAFSELQKTAGADLLRTVHEGIARAMRAQEGTVAAANAYAGSLRQP